MKFTVVVFALLVAANAAPQDFYLDSIAPYGWEDAVKLALQSVSNKVKLAKDIMKTATTEAINTAQTAANGGLKTAEEGVHGGFQTLAELIEAAKKIGMPLTKCLEDQVTITERNLKFFKDVQGCVDLTANTCRGFLEEGSKEIDDILDTFTKFCTESTCSNWLSCTALTGQLAVKEALAITQCGGKVPIIAAKQTAEVAKSMVCVTGQVTEVVKDVMGLLGGMVSCATECIKNKKCD